MNTDENSAVGNHLVADTITSNYARNGGRSGGYDSKPSRNLVIDRQRPIQSDEEGNPPVVLDGRNLGAHDISPTLQSKASGDYSLNYTPMVLDRQLAAPRVARQAKGGFTDPVYDNIVAFEARYARNGRGKPSPDVVNALRAEAGGYSGTGDSMPLIAFSSKNDGRDASDNVSPTLRAQNHDKSHMNGGGQVALAQRRGGFGWSEYRDVVPTLQHEGGSHQGGTERVPLVVPMQSNDFFVRRLTPTECERLQGFPDGWTEGQSDSVRYKQLGNAVAVPVVEWIGKRIAAVLSPT